MAQQTFKSFGDLKNVEKLKVDLAVVAEVKPNIVTTDEDRPPMPTSTHEWTWITPAIAMDFLSRPLKGNRAINRDLVEKRAKEMRTNKFRGENAETIKISDENNLLDGQHRLTACVETGKGFWALLVVGVPESCYDTIDRGKGKTAADTLTNHGYTNTNIIAAAVRWDHIICNRMVSYPDISSTETLEYVQKNPGMQEAATHINKLVEVKQLLPASMAASMFRLFSIVNPRAAMEFFDRLNDGVNLTATSPVYVLRERLQREQRTQAINRAPKYNVASFCINAFNSFRLKQPLTLLKGPLQDMHGEVKLPPIHGLPAWEEEA